MTTSEEANDLASRLQAITEGKAVISILRTYTLYQDLLGFLTRIAAPKQGQSNTPSLEQSPGTQPVLDDRASHSLDQSIQSSTGNTKLYSNGQINTRAKAQRDKASILHLLQDHMQAVLEQLAKRAGWQEPNPNTSDLICTKILITSSEDGDSHCDLLTQFALERKPGDPVVWPPSNACFRGPEQIFSDNLGQQLVISEDDFGRLYACNQTIAMLLQAAAESRQRAVSEKNFHNQSSELNPAPIPKMGNAMVDTQVCATCGHRVQQHCHDGACRIVDCSCLRFNPIQVQRDS